MNQYIENILIEKEAEARGLTKDPAIAAKIEDYTRSLYRNSLLQSLKEGQKSISDEEAKKYFQEHEEEFIQPDRVRLSLIEVDLDKEKEINAIQKDLKAGKDFAQLAMTHSKHVSGKRGGDIGFITQKQYKVLTDVAFTMKPGEISKPFKSPTGWTIIKVTEYVKKQDIPMEEGIKRARARLEATETSKSFDTLMKSSERKKPGRALRGQDQTASEGSSGSGGPCEERAIVSQAFSPATSKNACSEARTPLASVIWKAHAPSTGIRPD